MNDEMEEIIQEFITEAEESLDKIEPRFVELEQKGQDADLINDIFRSMHTIKGAAGFSWFTVDRGCSTHSRKHNEEAP